MDLISKIKLNTMEDVKEFVAAASECDFDIEVSYQGRTCDAKSLLGMLSVDLDQALDVISYGADQKFERVLERYRAKE